MSVMMLDGSKKNWTKWSMKFMAKATMQGYHEVLKGKLKIPPEDADVSADEKLSTLRRKNEVAYCELILSMTDEKCFNAIINAKTKILPNGDAALAWRQVNDIFNPKDATTKIRLMNEYANLKLRRIQEAEEWIV